MKLSVLAIHRQAYDLTHQGTTHSKEAFCCVIITNEEFKPAPDQDAYPQYLFQLEDKIVPKLRKALEQRLSKNTLKTRYLIQEAGGEQGQIQPHIIVRREDFKALSDKDILNIEHLLIDISAQINQKLQKKVKFDLNNNMFFAPEDEKDLPSSETANTVSTIMTC